MHNESDCQPINTCASAISEKDFKRLSLFIHEECGIKMPPAKKVMLESRLGKRLKALGLKSFKDYCEYLFSAVGMEKEMIHMINVVTTNKTDFFREPRHFDYLIQHAIPAIAGKVNSSKPLMIWSAGCSTGEEPYTLAMVLNEYAEKCDDFRYLILATDISTRVLDAAKLGIYCEDRVGTVPASLKMKYVMRGKNGQSGLVRIAPELREHVRFRRLNFMEGDFGFREHIDIIFCRNVIIYFDRQTQEMLMNKFYDILSPGGYIFIGHSETLNGLNVPFVQAAPTVYRKNAVS